MTIRRLPRLALLCSVLLTSACASGGATPPAAAGISTEEAPFLTPEQKRDIFYNNAARFLRLTPEQIARHHGQ